MNILNSKKAAVFFLTLITAIWGWSFVLVKESITFYPIFSFLSLRFLLGSFFLFPFLFLKNTKFDEGIVIKGATLGCLLFSGYAFQTFGLRWTTPSHSGFITGLFVVFTPILETFVFKRKITSQIIFSLIISTTGLFLLSFEPKLSMLNLGDFLSLICAIIYAFHILYLSEYSKKFDSLSLAFLQIVTVTLFATLFSFMFEKERLPIPQITLKGALLTAIFATSLSYFIQTKYQGLTTATEAALIFTMEPLFAGLFSYYLWGERFTIRNIIGGILIVSGMLMSQIQLKRVSLHSS